MTLDEQLSVLANRHRRRLLLTLAVESPHTIPTDPSDAADADDGDRERAIVMHHAHLPRLVDQGFIEWNQETGGVAKGPQFDGIQPLLTALDENYNARSAGGPPD
jgi:hypothetical protein